MPAENHRECMQRSVGYACNTSCGQCMQHVLWAMHVTDVVGNVSDWTRQKDGKAAQWGQGSRTFDQSKQQQVIILQHRQQQHCLVDLNICVMMQ